MCDSKLELPIYEMILTGEKSNTIIPYFIRNKCSISNNKNYRILLKGF